MGYKTAGLALCLGTLAALVYPCVRVWASLDDRLQNADKFAVVFLDFLQRWSLCDFESKTGRVQIREAADSFERLLGRMWSLSPVYLEKDVEQMNTIHIPLSDGSTIRGLMTRPKNASAADPLPLIIYLHGGGWVILNPDLFVDLRNGLAVHSKAIVVAVDYRKAPEHQFPTAVEDVIQSVTFLASQAKQLGIDTSRIAVAGDSAGGNLAAVVATHFRDHPQPGLTICHQVLIYPATLLADTETGTYEEFAHGYGLNKKTVDWFVNQYVNDRKQLLDPRVSPLLTENLENLPPATVVLAELDVVRGDGEKYAKRLEESGVDVELRVYPNTIHGFAGKVGNVPQTEQAILAMGRRLRSSFYDSSD